ncbi:hypothetical protein EGR_10886 [Echinococcus granulosus]|uniref:Uncharacterized protein n=1 Tax=Echinococcus granulosus TaxID=6210 RepID=W6TZT2_ECHGR|nr:hypothetical protein EGR_10886 [Echinococcus granulosus]EUB54253.1 hypothetical protein EGR_10886 [Echinococcus granulosus]
MVNAQHIEKGNNLDSSGVCHEFQPRLLGMSLWIPFNIIKNVTYYSSIYFIVDKFSHSCKFVSVLVRYYIWCFSLPFSYFELLYHQMTVKIESLALSDHVPRFVLFLSYSKVLYVLILLFVPLLKADVFA